MDRVWSIYLIAGPKGRRYVGQTVNRPMKRWREHLRHAARGTETVLYRAIRAHGYAAFSFRVITECYSQLEANVCERALIAQYGSFAPVGYNASTGGDSESGFTRSAESRALISKRRTGRKMPPISEEHKQRLREYATTRKKTPEEKAKLRASKLGKKRSPESRAKQAATMRANKSYLRLRPRIASDQPSLELDGQVYH